MKAKIRCNHCGYYAEVPEAARVADLDATLARLQATVHGQGGRGLQQVALHGLHAHLTATVLAGAVDLAGFLPRQHAHRTDQLLRAGAERVGVTDIDTYDTEAAVAKLIGLAGRLAAEGISIGGVAMRSDGRVLPGEAIEIVCRQSTASSRENILVHGIGVQAQQQGVDPAEATRAFLDFVRASPIIALPDIALAEARSIAERLCSMMSDAPFDIGQGRALPVTLSIGLAISEGGCAPAHLDSVTEIVDRADRALMRSKAAGRNQVTIGRSAA